MEFVHNQLIFYNKITIFFHFSCIFSVFSSNFPLLDPDPDSGGKINTDPSGSGSTLICTMYLKCTVQCTYPRHLAYTVLQIPLHLLADSTPNWLCSRIPFRYISPIPVLVYFMFRQRKFHQKYQEHCAEQKCNFLNILITTL